MRYRLLLCFFGLLMLCRPAFSQTSSKRCQWIEISARPFTLDSLTVVPGTLTFSGPGAANLQYHYNPATNQFRFILPDTAGAAPAGTPAAPASDTLAPSAVDTLAAPAADTLRAGQVPDTLAAPSAD